MKRVIFVVAIVFHFVCSETIEATLLWNWDSGTTEGWTTGFGYTTVNLEAGRNGSLGLGLQSVESYYPKVKIEGQSIDPGVFNGNQFGGDLNIPVEIYVDINRELELAYSNYIRIYIFGNNSWGSFVCNPFDELGSTEDLGDGWFRCNFVNHFRYSYDRPNEYLKTKAGTIVLEWMVDYNSHVVFDNLTMIPEPTSLVLLGLGGLMLRRRRA